MAYFAYNLNTKDIIQISNFEILEIDGADNYSISNHPASKEALEAEYRWDKELCDFVYSANTRLTKLQFLRRFTSEERIAIRELAKTNGIVFDAMELLNMAEYISVTDPDTITLINYLVYVGILSPERAQEILG